MEKIKDSQMEDISGGQGNSHSLEQVLNENRRKRIAMRRQKREPHDEEWRKRIRELAIKQSQIKSDPNFCSICVCGTCPGCGAIVGYVGDVCEECKKEVGIQ